MRELILNEYQIIIIRLIFFLIIIIGFAGLLYGLNYLVYSVQSQKYGNRHLFKIYEFGTTTVGNSQLLSTTHFFLLSAFFIIFDIELFFIYLWLAGLGLNFNILNYKINFILFILLLFIGLSYELLIGALSWYRFK